MIFHSPDSAEGKELAKWEQGITATVPHPLPWDQGGRYPRRFEMYPRMLYKAARTPRGPVAISDQIIVNSDAEERLMVGQGWSIGQAEALDAFAARDQDLAMHAANRAYHDRHLSEPARAELDAYEQSTSEHVAEVPRTPVKPRGRPRKSE